MPWITHLRWVSNLDIPRFGDKYTWYISFCRRGIAWPARDALLKGNRGIFPFRGVIFRSEIVPRNRAGKVRDRNWYFFNIFFSGSVVARARCLSRLYYQDFQAQSCSTAYSFAAISQARERKSRWHSRFKSPGRWRWKAGATPDKGESKVLFRSNFYRPLRTCERKCAILWRIRRYRPSENCQGVCIFIVDSNWDIWFLGKNITISTFKTAEINLTTNERNFFSNSID